MSCFLCDKPEVGQIEPFGMDRKVKYCKKHQQDIMIAIDALDDDPKALERLQKKYKNRK